MSQCYGPLAARYDALTGDVPYEALETWYETAFAHSGRAVHTVWISAAVRVRSRCFWPNTGTR